MKNRRNYYRILKVQPDAPLEIISSCYHTLMLKLKQHPDLGGEHWNAVILNEAYETLSDSGKRTAYDKALFEHYTKTPIPDIHSIKKPSISIFCPFCKILCHHQLVQLSERVSLYLPYSFSCQSQLLSDFLKR